MQLQGPLAGVTVVLDPGHGGADSGAFRHGVSEAALTYRSAVELAQDIHIQGGQVLFTVRSRTLNPGLAITEPPLERPRDAVLAVGGQPLLLRRDNSPHPLWQRAAAARRLWRSGSPKTSGLPSNLFFISLHYDDFHRPSVKGSLVCVDRRMTSIPLIARLLAARFCADGIARSDIYHGLRGISAGHLGVLDPKYNPIPQRVLVEMATLSNETNARCATDPNWRRGITARITEAIITAHDAGGLSSRAVPAVQ